MADLNAINERVNAAINELTRLQRQLEKELALVNPPADARMTRAEWEAANAAQADACASEAAAQSVAMGNTDAATVKQAEEAPSKAADTKPAAKS